MTVPVTPTAPTVPGSQGGPPAVRLPAPLPDVELPRIDLPPAGPPTVTVPLPPLPIVEPSAQVCVLGACLDLG